MEMPPSQVDEDRCPSPMALLRSGVPLSLLLDLAFGPDSEQVLRSEPPRPPRRQRW